MSPANPLTAPASAAVARRRTAFWLAAALVELPVLQGLEWDFEHCAPLLLLAPALWSGRDLVTRAVERFAQSALWLRIAAFALAAIITLSTLRAAHAAAATVAAAAWLMLALGAGLAGQLVAEEPALARRLLAALALGAAVATALHWIRWKLGAAPEAAYYPHHRLMGLHLLGGALAATALWATARATWALWLPVGVVTWGGLLWTGGRAPVLAVGLGLAVWWIRGSAALRRTLVLAAASQLAGGLLLSWALDPGLPHLGWIGSWQRTVAVSSTKELTSNRTDFWRDAWTHIQQAPWLGHGADAYRFLEPKLEGAQPHNVELQCLLDLGAPGTVIVLGLFALALCRGLRRAPFDDAAAGWVILAIASLAAGQLDGFFYHQVGLFAAALAFGISLGSPSASAVVAPRAAHWVRAWPVFALAAAAVLLLHLWLYYHVARARPPLPGSAVARIWAAFPSATLGMDRWVEAWEPQSPDAALALARAGCRLSSQGDYFHMVTAGVLLRHGDRAGALAEIDQALAIAPWQMRPVIAEQRRKIAGEGKP